ncbi:hypothetical protein CUN25_08630 [Enterococcus faecium]|nr:hypothetical protein [Enterococcus faecium]PCE10772.1 hypothetical protein CKY17_15480 [Enterococcus faecium]PQB79296.1 hypothetical protein CUN25_08630 [Enterococcus faecium]
MDLTDSYSLKGREKAVLHQVIRTVKKKQLLMFLIWLGLLPQMQAFEHRISEVVKKLSCIK